MGWAKFDDRRHTNGKLIAAGLAANGLDANGITYCAANETDGFIPEDVLPVLAPTISGKQRLALVDSLVLFGRWTRDDEHGGWWVHGFLDYHASHADLEKKREDDRARKRAAAAMSPRDNNGRFQAESNGNPSGFQPASTAPFPSLPDPSLPEGKNIHLSTTDREPDNNENREGATHTEGAGKLRELIVKLANTCSADNRETAMREAAIVIGLCAPHTPLELIERAITIIEPKNPVLPRFVLREIEMQRRLAGLPAVKLSVDGLVKRAG